MDSDHNIVFSFNAYFDILNVFRCWSVFLQCTLFIADNTGEYECTAFSVRLRHNIFFGKEKIWNIILFLEGPYVQDPSFKSETKQHDCNDLEGGNWGWLHVIILIFSFNI